MFKLSLIHRLSTLVFTGFLLTLTACTTTTQQQASKSNTPTTAAATINNKTTTPAKKIPAFHIVKSGETLSIIAQKYGLTYQDIAKLNKIPAPYNKIRVGQRLNLKGLKPVNTVSNSTLSTALKWVRPVSSHHRKFLQGQYHTVYYKGKVGDSIYAATDGYVVYADLTTNTNAEQHKTLNEKGHTVIITHADGYTSAYTHLSRILVPAGKYVKAGERIAELGQSGDVDEPLLGFQIKYQGKFINPRNIIP